MIITYCILLSFSALCDNAFESLSDKEKIYRHSTPKVHRLLDTLKTYTPFYAKDKPEKQTVAGARLNSMKSRHRYLY